MPRNKRTDKFYIIKSPANYRRVGKKQMIGVNVLRDGYERLTLHDLLEFLRERRIEPEKVLVSGFTSFITD